MASVTTNNLDDKNIFRDHEPLIANLAHTVRMGITSIIGKRNCPSRSRRMCISEHYRLQKKVERLLFTGVEDISPEILGELLELIRKAGKENRKVPVSA